MPKEISLSQGQFAVVDDDLYKELSKYKWYATKKKLTYYAERHVQIFESKRYHIKMHHAVIGKPPKGFVTDHKDGNGLNNKKCNLRFITVRQNSQNRPNCKFTSVYPRVSWYKRSKKWRASIKMNGKSIHLGLFAEEIDAAEIYRKAINNLGESLIQDQ